MDSSDSETDFVKNRDIDNDSNSVVHELKGLFGNSSSQNPLTPKNTDSQGTNTRRMPALLERGLITATNRRLGFEFLTTQKQAEENAALMNKENGGESFSAEKVSIDDIFANLIPNVEHPPSDKALETNARTIDSMTNLFSTIFVDKLVIVNFENYEHFLVSDETHDDEIVYNIFRHWPRIDSKVLREKFELMQSKLKANDELPDYTFSCNLNAIKLQKLYSIQRLLQYYHDCGTEEELKRKVNEKIQKIEISMAKDNMLEKIFLKKMFTCPLPVLNDSKKEVDPATATQKMGSKLEFIRQIEVIDEQIGIYWANRKMVVFVKNHMNKTRSYSVWPWVPVYYLKMLISGHEFVNEPEQRLFYGGKELRDDKSFLFYQLADSSTIHLVLRLPGGVPPPNTLPTHFIDPSFYDPDFDYDFSSINDGKEKFYRGGKRYWRPVGAQRFAVKVIGKYENEKWLEATGSPSDGEWQVAYHGTLIENVPCILQQGFDERKCVRYRYGKGVYCSPDPSVPLDDGYAGDFTSDDGKPYRLVLQTRVHPLSYKIKTTEDRDGLNEYWLLKFGRYIRPYGVLVYPNASQCTIL